MEDEIICSACGRPNLTRAERCWFCQSLLDKGEMDSAQNQAIEEEIEAVEKEILNRKARESALPDAPVPEWLKKIREMAKADMPPEERARWEQEHLFGDAIPPQPRKQAREKTSQTRKTPASPENRNAESENPPQVEPTDARTIDGENHEDESDHNPLPDGFKPLRS